MKKPKIQAKLERLANAYLDAKHAVVSAGYSSEIDWQEQLVFNDVTEEVFLREYTWVVFSSGFKETVVRSKFPKLSEAFHDFRSADTIVKYSDQCIKECLSSIANIAKAKAIVECAEKLSREGFASWKCELRLRGPSFLVELPYIGPITSLHLAKNIGLDVVKPDRHLVRIANFSGFSSPLELCQAIRQIVGDTLSVIDLILWRYATIEPRAYDHFSIA